MPTPREAYVNTVERQPFSGARVRAADFGAAGETLGRAAQGFGQRVGEVAQDVDEIQTIYAEAAAKDAMVQALTKVSAIRQSFQSLQKGDAIGAREKAVADIAALEGEITGQLKDGRARRMFKDAFLDRKLSAIEAIGTHETREVLAYEKDRTTALRDTALDLAADNYGNPQEMQVHLTTAANLEAQLRKGASPEELDQARREIRSKGLARAWTQIQDPLEKEAFRQQNAADIDPITESQLIERNQAGLFDARGDLIEADFFKSLGTGPVAPGEPGQGEEAKTEFVGKPVNPVSGKDYDPTGGYGHRTGDAASHARRGSHNKGIDIAAPAGTPIRPPTSGEVVDRGFDNTRGNWVSVRYDDGNTGIFLHLKGPPPVRQGEKVDPGTIIGSVGSTGRSTGNHVHYSVRDAAGNYVDPDTINYAGTAQPRLKPRDVDTAALYDKAYAYAEAKNLTPRETEQLLKRIDVRANRERSLQMDQDRVATDAAMEIATKLGESLTKTTQIPNFGSLPWETQARIKNQIEINTRPKEPDSYGQAYIDAMVTFENDPAAFRALPLDIMPMTREERARLKIKQGTLSNPDGTVNKSAIDDQDYITQRMNVYLKREKIIKGNQAVGAEIDSREELRERVVQRIAERERENGGKKLKQIEVDAIVQEAVTQVTYRAPSGERVTKRLYEIKTYEPGATLEISARDRARNALRRQNRGIPPTEAEINEFLRSQGID